MSLKEKILESKNDIKCCNCKHHETIEIFRGTDYCNISDKLILPMHVDCIRNCENFEEGEYLKDD